MKNYVQTNSWSLLQQNAAKLKNIPLVNFLNNPSLRQTSYLLHAKDTGLCLDFSKNFLTDEILGLFHHLLTELNFSEQQQALFNGTYENASEQQCVTHTLQRTPPHDDKLATSNVLAPSEEMLLLTERFSEPSRRLQGLTPITTIVHLGIGGADLGPRFLYDALSYNYSSCIKMHFFAAYDCPKLTTLLPELVPANTLVIVSSKSFTTRETLKNWQCLRDWLGPKLIKDNVVAITASPALACAEGINEKYILSFAKSIGGRFSLWSAVSWPLLYIFGRDCWQALFQGAAAMDQHFQTAAYDQNLPLIMAFSNFWYRHAWHTTSRCLIAYHSALSQFIPYCQQLFMESNGKHINRAGELLTTLATSVVWGGLGTNCQHSFLQLLQQGTDMIPVDFIAVKRANATEDTFYLDNCLAQSRILMQGYHDALPAHCLPGNRPSNTLILNDLSANTLGALIALYEHQTFVEGVLLNINSFDQWGVEYGKFVAKHLHTLADLDPSTLQLMQECNITHHAQQEKGSS